MEVKDTYGRGDHKYWRWVDGRQGSGYKVFYLLSWWLFDLVLIHYPEGSYIQWHRDPVPKGLEHHRINVVLKAGKVGGEFERLVTDPVFCVMTPEITRARFVRFRPDIQSHRVHKIVKGSRWVFSIGWVRKVK